MGGSDPSSTIRPTVVQASTVFYDAPDDTARYWAISLKSIVDGRLMEKKGRRRRRRRRRRRGKEEERIGGKNTKAEEEEGGRLSDGGNRGRGERRDGRHISRERGKRRYRWRGGMNCRRAALRTDADHWPPAASTGGGLSIGRIRFCRGRTTCGAARKRSKGSGDCHGLKSWNRHERASWKTDKGGRSNSTRIHVS
ncbi:hypothetical protein B296_00006060 [Ensete ventricosum]|uniref:Uncharacterized protein n=1 Tax=Ensete ventricosum TaxID=4639 RepID=A0A427ASI0_ENSVE|nr:hypothetical protein B296_00006060 [Ensete ventricosum]